MEAIAPDALTVELAREGKSFFRPRDLTVKRGIKTGHLGHIGKALREG